MTCQSVKIGLLDLNLMFKRHKIRYYLIKVSGKLFEVTEVYYDCINSLRIGVDFQALLMEKYAVNAGDVIDVEDTILKNLISLGVIINE